MRAINRFIQVFSAMILFAIVPSAFAQCSWQVLPVGIAFGVYSVFGGGNNTATASGTVRCTGVYQFQVLSTTGGGGFYVPNRVMSPGANYQVYINAGQTQIWGDGTAGTNVYTATNFFGGTNDFSGTAYGNVPGAQDLSTGAYSDNLKVTLQYRPCCTGAYTNVPQVNIPVSMTVNAECRVTTFDLAFGNYNPFTVGPGAGSAPVQVYCTKNTAPTLSLDNGSNWSGVTRRMKSGANFLSYTVSLSATTGTSTSSLIPIGAINVNGSIPANQDVPIGAYTDTLQVLVNY